MNSDLVRKTVGFVKVASLAVKKATDEVAVHRGAAAKAASARPALLSRMLETGAIAPNQKQAAEVMLGSHPETLALLGNAVEKIAEQRAAIEKLAAGGDGRLGGPDVAKEAGSGDYDSVNDPFVGRRTSQEKASDRAFKKILG